MKRLVKSVLLLCLACGFSSQCLGAMEDLLKVPNKWEVVKETSDYLIIEMVDDVSYKAEGKNGTYQVNLQKGQRRVFLKGRTYRSNLESIDNNNVKHNIEIEVHSDGSK